MQEYDYIFSASSKEQTNELYRIIRKYFLGSAYVYVVLDFGVVLGKYEAGNICVGFGDEKRIGTLPVEAVRELRIFDASGEFKAVRKGMDFAIRVCMDEAGSQKPLCKNEVQKIWGRVKQKVGIPGWSLLESERGSRILFPEEAELNAEKGLVVRKYIDIPEDRDGKKELFQFSDERLCGFRDWNAYLNSYAVTGKEEQNGI